MPPKRGRPKKLPSEGAMEAQPPGVEIRAQVPRTESPSTSQARVGGDQLRPRPTQEDVASVVEAPPTVDIITKPPPGEGQQGPERSPEIQGSQRAESERSASASERRKRHLALEAAEQRAKIRRRTLEEKEKIELELIDERLAAELGQVDADAIRRTQGSIADVRSRVNTWLGETSWQPAPAESSRALVDAPRDRSPSVSAMDISHLTKAIEATLNTVREASVGNGSNRLVNRLTSNRGLPTFDGDGLEWLRFKRAFEISTEVGGYSDRENISRLYESLKGEAKDAVSSLMLTASNTAQIMETLELRFGNKDVILREMVQGLKKLPKINSGKIDIVTLATKVKNAVAAMEAISHIGYLHSPDLALEIIGKMSSAMIYNYNHYLSENAAVEEPRMTTIARFLYKEAELACKAGTVRITTNQDKPDDNRQSKTKGGSEPAKTGGKTPLSTP